MSDRLSRIEERLRQVDDAIACLSQRLERLEQGSDLAANLAVAAQGSADVTQAARSDAVLFLSLAGRTCLVFGGAYLLRALTEAGHIPATIGVVLGLAYAIVWLAAADRAQTPSALFHGNATVLIGLPIVWEAAGRFRFLSPTQGAVALGAIVGLALIVAWHRRLPGLAGTIVVGAIATSIAVAATTGRGVPFVALLVATAGAALWIAYDRGWTWLAVVSGLAANLAVLAVFARAFATPPREPTGVVFALQLALLAVYFGSFTVRALVRSLGVFEYVQGALVLVIGLGGAIALMRGNENAITSIGVAALACASVAYWIAFGPMRRHGSSGATHHFFASLGLVLALAGLRLQLPNAPFVFALSVAAVAAIGAGRWARSSALMMHGAIAVAIAAAYSGALALIGRVWLTQTLDWPNVTVEVWGVIAAALVGFTLSFTRNEERSRVLISGIRTALGALTVAGLGTCAAISIGTMVSDLAPAAGIPAMAKSFVLAVSTVFLAWTRSLPGLAELSRLTYPLLVAVGLKILVEDLPSGRPAVLFVVLALYGASLILTTTVLRGGRRARPLSP
jgi:hypothetical protein